MANKEDDKSIESTLSDDLFENLDQLRLDQNFAEVIGVKKVITTIPVRKPHRQEFIRVHPNDSFYFQTAILEIKEDRESYMVVKNLWTELSNEITPKMIYTTINRQGIIFLWPIRLPDETGRLDEWNRSALKAAQKGITEWIKVASNRSLGAYETFKPAGLLPDPEWPDIEFKEILQIAFRDKIIDDINHPVLKQLRGEP
jgi:hypothetical protein